MRKRNLFIGSIFLISMFLGNTIGVNAAEYISASAPDSFVTNKAGRTYSNGQLQNISNDAVMANASLAANSTGRGNNIIDYHTSTGEKIFCIDRMTDYAQNATYTRSNESVDYGIVYIITNAPSYYEKFANKGTNTELELSWFTQIAIWKYQNANNFNSISMASQDIIEEGVQIDALNSYVYSNNALSLWTYANDLAQAAKNASGSDPSSVNDLTFNYDGKYSIMADNKSIKTTLISLQNSNSISNFSLDLSNAPSGTKVYRETNEEISDLTNIASATKFYLVIPVNNIQNFTYNFNISATANYEYYKGYKYTNGNNQPVVLVTSDKKPVTAALKIEGSQIENTASTISKTLYIAGLLILLCGVGIIYANVKPRKQQI